MAEERLPQFLPLKKLGTVVTQMCNRFVTHSIGVAFITARRPQGRVTAATGACACGLGLGLEGLGHSLELGLGKGDDRLAMHLASCSDPGPGIMLSVIQSNPCPKNCQSSYRSMHSVSLLQVVRAKKGT